MVVTRGRGVLVASGDRFGFLRSSMCPWDEAKGVDARGTRVQLPGHSSGIRTVRMAAASGTFFIFRDARSCGERMPGEVGVLGADPGVLCGKVVARWGPRRAVCGVVWWPGAWWGVGRSTCGAGG